MNQSGTRTRLRRMSRLPAAGVALAATAAAVLSAGGPLAAVAAAATITVSPADRIDTADGFCTIGYTYSGTDGHTYAITAGHCATHAGQRVTDTDTGAVGVVVHTDVDDEHRGGPDYGLIDFGRHVLALGFLGNYPVADAHPDPRPGQAICHTGASSGQQCGHVSDSYGTDQYLTDDMNRSIPGDSGGPVWTLRGDGRVDVIGIWLGGRRTFGGHDAGRFATLTQAFSDLT